MKKLPDLTDDVAMAARGRRSALLSARNDACEVLRTVFLAAQNSDATSLDAIAQQLRDLASHMTEIARVAQENK